MKHSQAAFAKNGVVYDKNLKPLDSILAARGDRLLDVSSSFETVPARATEGPAFEFTNDAMSTTIQLLIASKADQKPLAHVAHAPAGIGKTTSTIEAISEKIRNGLITNHVVHFVINHRLADETRAAYLAHGVEAKEVVIWKGQGHADMCQKHETVRKRQSMSLRARDLCKACEYRSDCAFLRIRSDMAKMAPPKILLAPVEYIRSGGLPKRVLEGDTDLVIIDEAVHQTMIDHGKINLSKFGEIWNRSYASSAYDNDAPDLMHDLSMQIASTITEHNVVGGLMRGHSSPDGLIEDVAKIIDYREAELSDLVPLDGDYLGQEMARKQVPNYVEEDLKIWNTLLKQLREINKPASKKTAWIMKRTDRNSTFIEYVNKVEFPFQNTPVLLLDASADKAIHSALFGSTHECQSAFKIDPLSASNTDPLWF
ncbi:hypothetical protein ACEWPM_016795 [Roseovarius sp. S4756]|uniref:hypothetical protein n=1 Tax=Roseovarius maritimus TaxID=3342637 RepID=UPI0037292009